MPLRSRGISQLIGMGTVRATLPWQLRLQDSVSSRSWKGYTAPHDSNSLGNAYFFPIGFRYCKRPMTIKQTFALVSRGGAMFLKTKSNSPFRSNKIILFALEKHSYNMPKHAFLLEIKKKNCNLHDQSLKGTAKQVSSIHELGALLPCLRSRFLHLVYWKRLTIYNWIQFIPPNSVYIIFKMCVFLGIYIDCVMFVALWNGSIAIAVRSFQE